VETGGEVAAGVVENLSSDDAEDFSVDHGDADFSDSSL
jgi:hypothetical protein